jgi:membrane protein YdbS with pleckstrin-like domain
MADSSVNGLELVITVGMGAIMAAVLAGMNILDGGSAITFVSMVVIGFIAVRTVRGRRWTWR